MSTYTERAKEWRETIAGSCRVIGERGVAEALSWAADCDRLTAELAEARAECERLRRESEPVADAEIEAWRMSVWQAVHAIVDFRSISAQWFGNLFNGLAPLINDKAIAIMRRPRGGGWEALRRAREEIQQSHDWVSDKQQKWGLASAMQVIDRLLASAPAEPEPNPEPLPDAWRELLTGFVDAISDVMPDEPLDELSRIFSLETKRAHWERLVDLRDCAGMMLRDRQPESPPAEPNHVADAGKIVLKEKAIDDLTAAQLRAMRCLVDLLMVERDERQRGVE